MGDTNVKHLHLFLFYELRICTHCCFNSLLLVSPADNICEQFGPKSGLTKHLTRSGSKLFDTLIIVLKNISKQVIVNKKTADGKNMTITQHTKSRMDVKCLERHNGVGRHCPRENFLVCFI